MSRNNDEMAYIAEITHLFPIEGADLILKAVVNCGWPVVVKKDDFRVGDLVVMAEIDSWVPTEIAPFLSKGKEPRIYNDIKGERLRTVKLRGQKSQGLVLPLSVLPVGLDRNENWQKGEFVGLLLGIQKWETPDTFQSGMAKGSFPGWMQKSDQERCQNLAAMLFTDEIQNTEFEITMKLDGSSTTVCWRDDEFVICSRNLQLKNDDEKSTFVRVAKQVFGENGELLKDHKDLAFQGELIGPAIQKNREGLPHAQLFIYDIYDITKAEYLLPTDRIKIVTDLGLQHVPVLDINTLKDIELTDLEKMLAYADGPSINHPVREGVVFKSMTGQFSFKAISDDFLMKEKD